MVICIPTQKIDGFWNPIHKIDGFPGTHGTHANGATELCKTATKTLVMGLRKEIMKDKFYLIQDYYVSLKMAL